MLIDGVGAIQLPRSCFKDLKLAGIETAIFSPLLARKTQGPRNLRNHRKMAIADGAQLWAGGRNIAAEYFIGVKGEKPWLDLSFDLQGRQLSCEDFFRRVVRWEHDGSMTVIADSYDNVYAAIGVTLPCLPACAGLAATATSGAPHIPQA